VTAAPVNPTPPSDPAKVAEPQDTRSAADLDPRLLVDQAGLRGYVTAFTRRVRGGELGSLPVVIGLIVIWLVFQTQSSSFLTSQNLSNLAQQMVSTGLIAVGVVMVLLLGEVDLSVGSVSGFTSAILATQIVNHGTNEGLAIVIALAAGALVGVLHGVWFTRIGVPAFVVTLAGLLFWQGAQLGVLGTSGSVTLPQQSFVRQLSTAFYPKGTGYAIAAVIVVVYLAAQLFEVRSRRGASLRPRPVVEVVARCVVLAVLLGVAVTVLNGYRGVPQSLVIFVVVVLVFDLVIRRTRYGRHVLAVGGNTEAARRAGISVSGIRISVFALAGLMAAAGGIMAASYLNSVGQASGGSTTLLYAIAAAVIGGTSLFGGRGSAWSALLGVLVITSITNGMALLSFTSSTQFMVTGAVLLIAASIDALGRRGRAASGRG
jgi:D-xylose transport system permease protein